MSINIVTKQDLSTFKTELLEEIRSLLTPPEAPKRQLLKTWEVKAMLGISSGTLRNMRKHGKIEYTKIGGLVFYNYCHIQQLIEANKKHTHYPKKPHFLSIPHH